MILRNTVARIVGLSGVFNKSCEPNVRETKVFDALQHVGRKSVHLGRPILFERAIGDIACRGVAIKSGENLIDNHSRKSLSVVRLQVSAEKKEDEHFRSAG